VVETAVNVYTGKLAKIETEEEFNSNPPGLDEGRPG